MGPISWLADLRLSQPNRHASPVRSSSDLNRTNMAPHILTAYFAAGHLQEIRRPHDHGSASRRRRDRGSMLGVGGSGK
jgi:hypothetical protein